MNESTNQSCIYQLTKYSKKVVEEISRLYLIKIRRDTGPYGGYQVLNEELTRRWEMMDRFNSVFDGKHIPVWESGMDCDCVQYGHASLVKVKSYWDYHKYVEAAYYNAEGPISISIIPTWEDYYEAFGNRYSFDLIAEATENGHPHVVYPH